MGGDSESSSDDSDGSDSGVQRDTDDEHHVMMRKIAAATTTPLESPAATNLAETLRQVDLNQGPKRSLEKPPGGTSCL